MPDRPETVRAAGTPFSSAPDELNSSGASSGGRDRIIPPVLFMPIKHEAIVAETVYVAVTATRYRTMWKCPDCGVAYSQCSMACECAHEPQIYDFVDAIGKCFKMNEPCYVRIFAKGR